MSNVDKTSKAEEILNAMVMKAGGGKTLEESRERVELKKLYLRAQYLNSALPILEQMQRIMRLRGEERFEYLNTSHDVIVSTAFNGDFCVEIRKNEGGQKAQWVLRSGNGPGGTRGWYNTIYLAKDLNTQALSQHRVACSIRQATAPGSKHSFLALNHWIHRLFLAHTRMAIDAHQDGIDFLTQPK